MTSVLYCRLCSIKCDVIQLPICLFAATVIAITSTLYNHVIMFVMTFVFAALINMLYSFLGSLIPVILLVT